LNNHSRAPIRRRKSLVRKEIIEFIKRIREERGRIGKEKIKVFLDEYCEREGYRKISTSTIGRIIKKEEPARKRISFYARSGKIVEREIRRKKRLRRKGYKPVKPGDLLQMDSVFIFMNGVKRYILSAIDVKTRFGFCYMYERLTSSTSLDFMKKIEEVFPFKIKRIQTDNGSEFAGHFDQYLRKKNIIHYWNYPKTPKSNAFVERFNRSLEEEFIEWKAPPVYEREAFLSYPSGVEVASFPI